MSVLSFTSNTAKRKKIIEDLGPMPSSVTFPTYTTDLYYQPESSWQFGDKYTKYDKRRVLMHGEEHVPLAVVSKTYNNTKTHADQFNPLEEMILASDLNIEGLERTIETSHDGGRAYARYKFPSHTIEIDKDDPVSLEILARNSFDFSWPTIFEGGGWRMVCTNLMVFGTVVAIAKRRHTKNLDIQGAIKELGNCLDHFLAETEKWKEWRAFTVHTNEAFGVFAELSRNQYAQEHLKELNSNELSILQVLNESAVSKNKTLTYLWEKYTRTYRPAIGNNLWAVFNTLTDWSTHNQEPKREKTNQTVASMQVAASERVRKVLNMNETFRRAAA